MYANALFGAARCLANHSLARRRITQEDARGTGINLGTKLWHPAVKKFDSTLPLTSDENMKYE